MHWYQRQLQLKARPRGFHMVTAEIERQLPELKKISKGTAHLFLQHTSASLTINENVSADVRSDMEAHLNTIIPENAPYYEHIYEGADDMPAHIKSSLLGCALTVPVTDGSFNLGTWQGIYLGEHRNHGGGRRLLVTLTGE